MTGRPETVGAVEHAADMTSYCLFPTAIGVCAVVWGHDGLVGVDLPDRSEATTRAGVRRRHPGALEKHPPAQIAALVHGLRALLAGDAVDLPAVALDLRDVAEFDRQVLAVTRVIPRGSTRTYGEIAATIGAPAAAQAVGRALGRNPFPLVVPCHRVVASDGRTGGFSAPGGVRTKRRLLEIERAPGYDTPTLFAVDDS